MSGGAHGAEYWFRRARDQGHLDAAIELERVKSANVKALRGNKLVPRASTSHVNDVSDFDHRSNLIGPNRRGANASVSDLWIRENAQLATEEWLTEIIDRA